MIRGRRAHGAALATLPTCAHLSPDSQARLHRAGSVPYKPKTLKMSAYGFVFFPLLRDPQGSCQHRGRCPHPRSPRGRGAGKNLLHPYHRALGRLQPVKAKPLRGCFASLDRFQLKSASVSLLPHGDGEGSRATKSCIFTLDALESTNTHRRGRWIGLPPAPAASQVSGVWGKAQRLIFVFEVVRVDVTVQKGQKNVHFRIFATKNTANLANF